MVAGGSILASLTLEQWLGRAAGGQQVGTGLVCKHFCLCCFVLLQAVAGAALAASALMNAPPGFLEFLLCIPWRRLPQLYPSTGAATKAASASRQEGQQQPQQPAQQDLLAESAANEAERRLLVNLPVHPQLVRPVLQFMYKPQHADSVPPVLRPEKRKAAAKQTQEQQHVPGQQQQQQQQKPAQSVDCTADENLMAVAEALLDGATPLHCAALRGNPAQVDHLLYCGADPTRKTAVGDLPLQLVPRCGGYSSGVRMCTCLGPAEQEVRAGGRLSSIHAVVRKYAGQFFDDFVKVLAGS